MYVWLNFQVVIKVRAHITPIICILYPYNFNDIYLEMCCDISPVIIIVLLLLIALNSSNINL